jgi:murein L,D-transpeptidase YcbB/YkuD
VLPPDNLETPQFKAKTSHLVVNPTWYVPRNILTKEMLPEIKRDPEILKKMGYILKNSRGEEVDPLSVNWEKVSPTRVPYTLEQLTGADNSLGKVVVHFPNAYSIFLHDTPNKWAFSLSERHVSHGCVRLEKPFDLVEFLMYFNKKDRFDDLLMTAGFPPRHDEERLEKWEKEKPMRDTSSQKPKQDQYFYLDSMLPVYLVYITAVSMEHDGLSVFRDIYRQNDKIISAMRRPAAARKVVLKD